MSRPEIISSAVVGKKLLLNGHIYHRKLGRKVKTYWYCTRRDECKATAITRITGEEIIVEKESQHTHAASPDLLESRSVLARVKRAAVDQLQATPAQILRQELPGVHTAVLSQLPDR